MNSPIGLFTSLKIVHGKPRHCQSQGSVERTNQEVKETILNLIKNQRDDSSREIFKRISDVRDLVPMSGSYLPQSLSVKVTQRFVGNWNSLKYTTK
jgi:hypothetical protein